MLLPQTPHTCLLCEVHQKLTASGKRVKSLLIAQQLKLMPEDMAASCITFWCCCFHHCLAASASLSEWRVISDSAVFDKCTLGVPSSFSICLFTLFTKCTGSGFLWVKLFSQPAEYTIFLFLSHPLGTSSQKISPSINFTRHSSYLLLSALMS